LIYFTLASTGVVLAVNTFGTKVLGYRREELVGQSMLTVFHKEDHTPLLQQLGAAWQQPGRIVTGECRTVCKDGSILWTQETIHTVQTAEG
jgi:PAS domain S-box-containing protein